MLRGFVFNKVAFFDVSEQERNVVDTISKIIKAFIVLVLVCFFNILKQRLSTKKNYFMTISFLLTHYFKIELPIFESVREIRH